MDLNLLQVIFISLEELTHWAQFTEVEKPKVKEQIQKEYTMVEKRISQLQQVEVRVSLDKHEDRSD